MNIALFALAVVMIVGGIASVIQGFPFVRLESGLAMTIAGATTASAGAVLLGIAAVATRLRSLETALLAERDAADRTIPQPRETAPLRDAASEGTAEPFAPEPVAGDPMVGSVAARQRPSLVGIGLGSLAGLSATRAGTEPTFTDPISTDPTSTDPQTAPEAEPLLPDLLPPVDAAEARHEPAPAPEAVEPPPPAEEMRDDDLFATPVADPIADPSADPSAMTAEATVPPPAAHHEHPAEVPALAETAPAEETPEPVAPAEETLHVVGTYASGGNTYVMYSNGSIEADTPRGRYTFDSLDELKVFVESGGESEARGAA